MKLSERMIFVALINAIAKRRLKKFRLHTCRNSTGLNSAKSPIFKADFSPLIKLIWIHTQEKFIGKYLIKL